MTFTTTPEGPFTRLRLADGREGLFVSQDDATAKGERLTCGAIALVLPAPMSVNLRMARQRDIEAEALFGEEAI